MRNPVAAETKSKSIAKKETEKKVAKTKKDKSAKSAKKKAEVKTEKDKSAKSVKKKAETKTKKADSKAKKASTTKSGTAKPVNINKADAKELATLDGIGEERAKNIVSYRKKNGKFKKPEDLLNISGIGPKIYDKNKKRIKLK